MSEVLEVDFFSWKKIVATLCVGQGPGMSFASGYCILRHVRERRAQLLEMSRNDVFFISDLQWMRINFDGKKTLFCHIRPECGAHIEPEQ